MSLRWKLFISYVVVLAVGLLVLALSVAVLAPQTFTHRMQMGMGQGHGMMRQEHWQEEAELEADFRAALNDALLRTGIAALIAAALVSWLMAWYIVRPVKALVAASQRIAGGHYQERLHLRSNDELGDLIGSFNDMAAALEQTESLREQLIADVSHELKTPLASIMGLMEGLQDGVIPPNPETFQLVHQEADRMKRLVQDLQELSRAEAGQIVFQLRPCEPAALVKFALERLRPQFNEKGIALGCAVPDGLPLVRADFERTGQVLLNLLGNALQYTPTAGHVTVKAERRAGEVCFCVQDDGVGLAEDDLERVFQRFYRVDKSRSRASGGSGIGLTIARYLIEAQGGRIWAESAGLGRGSSFAFTLPCA